MQALESAEPANLKFAINETASLPLVGVSREPFIHDKTIRVLQVVSLADDRTLGTLLNRGNHREAFWPGNLKISSDFPHYWREYIENSIY